MNNGKMINVTIEHKFDTITRHYSGISDAWLDSTDERCQHKSIEGLDGYRFTVNSKITPTASFRFGTEYMIGLDKLQTYKVVMLGANCITIDGVSHSVPGEYPEFEELLINVMKYVVSFIEKCIKKSTRRVLYIGNYCNFGNYTTRYGTSEKYQYRRYDEDYECCIYTTDPSFEDVAFSSNVFNIDYPAPIHVYYFFEGVRLDYEFFNNIGYFHEVIFDGYQDDDLYEVVQKLIPYKNVTFKSSEVTFKSDKSYVPTQDIYVHHHTTRETLESMNKRLTDQLTDATSQLEELKSTVNTELENENKRLAEELDKYKAKITAIMSHFQ